MSKTIRPRKRKNEDETNASRSNKLKEEDEKETVEEVEVIMRQKPIDAPEKPTVKADSQFQQGCKLLAKQQFDSAIQCFNKAVDIYENEHDQKQFRHKIAVVKYWLCCCHLLNGKQKIGIEILRESYKLLPIKRKIQIPGWKNPPKNCNRPRSSVYAMKNPIRGPCLIINNYEFAKHSRRLGAITDATHLAILFHVLQFHVTIKNNLTASEIKDTLLGLSQNREWSNANALAVIILSHGCGGGVYGSIYGVDGHKANVNEILEYFANSNSDCRFIGKPKLFFIQACRGNLNVLGYSRQVLSDGTGNSELDLGSIPTSSQASESCVESTAKLQQKPRVKSQLLPRMSDTFIWHSTLAGNVSCRCPHSGTLFISSLIGVFSKHANTKEFWRLVQMVNSRIKKPKNGISQTTEAICRGWEKDLYFNPQYSETCYLYSQDDIKYDEMRRMQQSQITDYFKK